ncbi:MAG TPA: hypothetical protein VIF60_10240 [Burkholderiaceae bacterium]|jgi:CO/xanthine dehydrogenase Mo-binding subunit
MEIISYLGHGLCRCGTHQRAIEAILVKNDDLAPQGGGEPPITTVGAVIANAIFDACGARVSHLPITADRLREGVAAGIAAGVAALRV